MIKRIPVVIHGLAATLIVTSGGRTVGLQFADSEVCEVAVEKILDLSLAATDRTEWLRRHDFLRPRDSDPESGFAPRNIMAEHDLETSPDLYAAV